MPLPEKYIYDEESKILTVWFEDGTRQVFYNKTYEQASDLITDMLNS